MSARGRVVCIGGACVDRKYHVLTEIRPASSNPSRMVEHWGGVARNVAENLCRLGVHVTLFSAIGDDRNGRAMLDALQACGIDHSLVRSVRGGATSEYAAVIGRDGDLVIGVSDLRVVDTISVADLAAEWTRIAAHDLIFLDTNPTVDVIAEIVKLCREGGPRLVVDVVSEAKARKLPANLTGIELLVLNHAEAGAYLREPDCDTPIEQARALRARGARHVILTLGKHGYVVADNDCVEYPPVEATRTDATGAGDALVAGTILRLLAGDDLHRAARIGSLVAALTIESSSTVGPDMSAQWLASNMYRIKDL